MSTDEKRFREVRDGHTIIQQNVCVRQSETTGAIEQVAGNLSLAESTNQSCCVILLGQLKQALAQPRATTVTDIEGTMTRRTIEQRIAQLEAKKKTLQARLGKQERARDTRRKVLLGALVLHRIESEASDTSAAWLRTWLAAELPAFLTRDMDKALLADLMVVAASAPKPPAADPSPLDLIDRVEKQFAGALATTSI